MALPIKLTDTDIYSLAGVAGAGALGLGGHVLNQDNSSPVASGLTGAALAGLTALGITKIPQIQRLMKGSFGYTTAGKAGKGASAEAIKDAYAAKKFATADGKVLESYGNRLDPFTENVLVSVDDELLGAFNQAVTNRATLSSADADGLNKFRKNSSEHLPGALERERNILDQAIRNKNLNDIDPDVLNFLQNHAQNRYKEAEDAYTASSKIYEGKNKAKELAQANYRTGMNNHAQLLTNVGMSTGAGLGALGGAAVGYEPYQRPFG